MNALNVVKRGILHETVDQKEEEIRQATLEKRKRQENVPGVLNPHEREDNMDG